MSNTLPIPAGFSRWVDSLENELLTLREQARNTSLNDNAREFLTKEADDLSRFVEFLRALERNPPRLTMPASDGEL